MRSNPRVSKASYASEAEAYMGGLNAAMEWFSEPFMPTDDADVESHMKEYEKLKRAAKKKPAAKKPAAKRRSRRRR